jgi:eukaryotic-like serine/threonine-protein kinase
MLQPGTRLGAYEIVGKLGAGGMGEVYRANDASLGRQVAVKVLPAAFADDADRMARFAREARILASLNHPNIAHVYGLERLDGRDGQDGRMQALVMELVDGPTLADRLAEGPVPIDKAISIARQIANALEAAHDQGIVHRDLKPANIKLRPDGTVKVLDFGLAKTVTAGRGLETDLANLPTITSPAMTEVGVIAGTAAYMSPEQTSGQFVDKRSDIWAFGCVLFEMLTGRRVFHAPTVTATMAAVLERTVDLTGLPSATPPGVRTVLRRTLERDPQRRLHDIADARIELDDNTLLATTAPAAVRRSSRRWTAALAATGLALGAGGWFFGRSSSTPSTDAVVTRLPIAVEAPMSEDEGMLALSPDGRRLAYVVTSAGKRQMFLRELDQIESRLIPGTEGAANPAFSPNGRWIAFESATGIKKVAAAGGEPVTVSPVTVSERFGRFGLSWESNDSILFHPGYATGIWRVPAAGGGTPSVVTKLRAGETQHHNPSILPGGRVVLFDTDVQVFAESLATGERRALVRGTGAKYLSTGHLVYALDGTVFAVPFDIERLELKGTPTAVVQYVQQTSVAPQIAYSDSGSMVYIATSGARENALVWVNRDGVEQETAISAPYLSIPRLAPDGSQLALRLGANAVSSASGGDIWVFDLARNTRNRVTFDDHNTFPMWTPDGRGLTFSSLRDGRQEIHVKALDSTSPDEWFPAVADTNYPMSWSPDGRFLAAVAVSPTTANDIWMYTLGKPPTARPFVQTRYGEGGAMFSPDGRFIVYASNRSSRSEVYMRPFPGPGQEWTISTEGGTAPMWARKSGQLFYLQGDAMMVVDITTTPAVTVGKPRRLFERRYASTSGFWANYDVTADGQRFLMVKSKNQEAPNRINVVLNWFEELKRLAPLH